MVEDFLLNNPKTTYYLMTDNLLVNTNAGLIRIGFDKDNFNEVVTRWMSHSEMSQRYVVVTKELLHDNDKIRSLVNDVYSNKTIINDKSNLRREILTTIDFANLYETLQSDSQTKILQNTSIQQSMFLDINGDRQLVTVLIDNASLVMLALIANNHPGIRLYMYRKYIPHVSQVEVYAIVDDKVVGITRALVFYDATDLTKYKISVGLNS